ncbi:hypothetical protein [Bacillus sp. Marseille-P3661]|nr:hypothetical protein [Bacillus sp. Marseille-P3661]
MYKFKGRDHKKAIIIILLLSLVDAYTARHAGSTSMKKVLNIGSMDGVL